MKRTTERPAQDWATRGAAIVVPVRRESVVVEAQDDEATIWDPANGETYHLNRTACAVWQDSDGSTTTRQIAERLTDSFDVDRDTALDHVEQVVSALADAGLLGSAKR